SGADAAPHFCPRCRALQPPAPRPDLFRLMECERSFRVDAQRLQRRFRSLQRALHPDRFGRRPPKEQHYSEQHSSLINKAYQTLLHPLSRGLYLLELNGVEPAQETDCDADSEFLMEIMEINEKLAEPGNDEILAEIETVIKGGLRALGGFVHSEFHIPALCMMQKSFGRLFWFSYFGIFVTKFHSF
ncbi:hypothetical protein CIB84_016755, partial [Bambusicola thoracicus]